MIFGEELRRIKMKKQITILTIFFCFAWGSSALAGVLTEVLAAKAKPSSVSLLSLSSFLKESREKNVEEKYVNKVLSESNDLQKESLPAEPYMLKATEALAKGVSPQKSLSVLGKTRDNIKLATSLSDQLLSTKSPQEARYMRPRLFDRFYTSLNQGIPSSHLTQVTRHLSSQGKRWTWAQFLDSLISVRTNTLVLPNLPNVSYSKSKSKEIKQYNYRKYKKKSKGPPAHAPAHGYRRKK